MPYTVLDPALAQPMTQVIGAPRVNVGITLNALVEELDALLLRRADIPSERLELWLNEAYIDLATSLELDELRVGLSIELSAEQPLYRLPPNLTITEEVAVLGALRGFPLEKIDLRTYRALEEQLGAPKLFFRQGDMLVLWPSPDRLGYLLVVDGLMAPLPMTLASHSPIVGPEWHEGIKLLAKQKAYSALMEYDKALEAGNDYVQFVRRRTDRKSREERGRIVGSSVPGRIEELRNRRIRMRQVVSRDDLD
jgi:hypothetical protein